MGIALYYPPVHQPTAKFHTNPHFQNPVRKTSRSLALTVNPVFFGGKYSRSQREAVQRYLKVHPPKFWWKTLPEKMTDVFLP